MHRPGIAHDVELRVSSLPQIDHADNKCVPLVTSPCPLAITAGRVADDVEAMCHAPQLPQTSLDLANSPSARSSEYPSGSVTATSNSL